MNPKACYLECCLSVSGYDQRRYGGDYDCLFADRLCQRGFSFAAMGKNTLDGSWQHLVFVCAFVGFALKAGLVPLHVWLPKAHPAAPSHVSALMSGVMLKIALYGFGRFMFSFLPAWNYWWCVAVLLAGVVSAFFGRTLCPDGNGYQARACLFLRGKYGCNFCCLRLRYADEGFRQQLLYAWLCGCVGACL